MLIYDGVFEWEGWGGKLKLGKGHCHLRLHDRTRDQKKEILLLKPYVAIVCELPGNTVSVRAYTGHIATGVVKKFDLAPHRLLWIEYYPERTYGASGEHSVPERYDAIEFTWEGRKAVSPRCQTLKPPLLDTIKAIAAEK